MHVVLHDDHGAGAIDAAQEVGGLGGGHAGHGLGDEEEGRVLFASSMPISSHSIGP
jgi:hypothetical protein